MILGELELGTPFFSLFTCNAILVWRLYLLDEAKRCGMKFKVKENFLVLLDL